MKFYMLYKLKYLQFILETCLSPILSSCPHLLLLVQTCLRDFLRVKFQSADYFML